MVKSDKKLKKKLDAVSDESGRIFECPRCGDLVGHPYEHLVDAGLKPSEATALLGGSKTFEVRYNDRAYQKGDTLRFYGTDDVGKFRAHYFTITHVHSGLGMKDNYVVLAVTGEAP